MLLLQCALVHAVTALHPSGVKIFYDPKHATHSNAKGHPETPRRVDDCRRALERTDATWQYLKQARTDAEDSVRRVHSNEHISRVKRASKFYRMGRTRLAVDTYAKRGSHQTMLRAQSLWLDAVDHASSTNLAVALSRPPGHHASRHVADGFCLYNFAAGAAAYALDVLGKDWVALLDFDVHHGNGIAAYADEEARVTYASAHQAPLWPNTGDDPSDTGLLGNRLNACVKRGADSSEFCGAWDRCLRFVADRVSGSNGLLVVSAGFDALLEDPLAQCRLRPEDYVKIGRATRDAAETLGVPVVLGLEGGYSTRVGESFAHSIRPWLGDDEEVVEVEAPPKLSKRVEVCDASKLPEPGALKCVATKHGPLTIATTSDGAAYALQRRLPPFGLCTSAYGDFDGQVRTVKDRGSGTKFYVDSGDVRGPWCPSILPKRPLARRRRLPVAYRDATAIATARLDVVDGVVMASSDELEAILAASIKLDPKLRKRRRRRGLVTQRAFSKAAANDRATVSTSITKGELRTTAVTSTGLELGYYLVRLPDEPTPGTDDALAAILHGGDSARVERDSRRGTAKVAAGVAVFVEPAARGRNIGEVLFKEAMRACRALDFRYMLFVERDGGSGKLIRWYEAMGFRVVPPDVLPGLDRAMVGYLPSDQTFYDVEGVGLDVEKYS